MTIESQGRLSVLPNIEADSSGWTYRTRLEGVEVVDGDETTTHETETPAESKVGGTTVTQRYERGISVTYEVRNNGLKQSLKIGDALAGSDALRLRWSTPEGATLSPRSNGGVGVGVDGRTKFSWSKLIVRDAEGQTVPATMEVGEDGDLVYALETKGAAFPLTIDPLGKTIDFDEGSMEGSSFFGHTVDSAGDVNGDGYTDLLVAQIGHSEGGVASVGQAHLFLGSSNGLARPSTEWSPAGDTLAELYGIGTGIGDIDGDGNGDVAVAGFGWRSGGDKLGRVELYLGGAPNTGLQTGENLTLEGNQAGESFGRSLAGGDFNCDGTPDLAVGSSGYDGSAGADSGQVTVFFGSSSAPYLTDMRKWTFTPSKAGGVLGFDTENAGDVNGDGCDDLLVGGQQYRNSNGNGAGVAMIFYGQMGTDLGSSPDWDRVGPVNSQYGRRVSTAGDVNGDGFADVAVAAPNANTTDGLVHVFYGGSNGPGQMPDWTESGANNAELGYALSSGDLNGDGTPDLVIGARSERNPNAGGERQGAVHAYLTQPSGTQSLPGDPTWTSYGGDAGSIYGFTAEVLQDVNAKPPAEADLFAGAPFHSGKSGKVFGYHGKPTCFIGNTYYGDGDENPNNPCQICNPSNSTTSWSMEQNGTTCDDGDACTVGTTCQMGQCKGQTRQCDDQNPCTQNTCDASTGCEYPNESQGTSCPDDGLSCTTDQCDGSGSCTHPISQGCLINGTCVAAGTGKQNSPCKQCVPSKSKTTYSSVSDGTSCDDGEFCTTNDTCTGGTCGGQSRDCAATLGPKIASCNTQFTCDDFQDRCIAEPAGERANDTPCNDGNACTIGKETCQGGTCTDQGAVDCDDGNPCTADSCTPMTGCENTDVMDGTKLGMGECNADNNLLQAATCQGGMEQPRQVQDCGNYKCTADPMPQCPEACEADADCKDGSFCFDLPNDQEMPDDKECHPNRVPTADAGPAQMGYSRDERVTLDGTQSSDPDQGDSLNYDWQLVDAECPAQDGTADLDRLRQALNNDQLWDPTAANPTFRAPAPDCEGETLTFELVVNDGEFNSEPAQTTVSYGDCNDSPNAVIGGTPSTAQWGGTVTLDGSQSTTGCGPQLEYSWSYSPQDPTLETTALEGGSLQVDMPDICRETSMTYTFSLTVFDGVQNSEPFARELFVPANGPCQAEPSPEVGPDAGPDTGMGDTGMGDTGPISDAGRDVGAMDELGGSSCFCAASGRQTDTVPGSLMALLMFGGALWARRRRRR